MYTCETIIPFEVSKWVKLPCLVDLPELKQLIQIAPPFKVYNVGSICSSSEGIYTPDEFLESYSEYVECLKSGQAPSLKKFRFLFSGAWSVSQSALYALRIEENRRFLKPREPIVQTQPSQVRYSKEEHLMRPQVFGDEGISWGIQFGFPALYLDSKTGEVSHTREFPNGALFSCIQKWVRVHTSATPFIAEDKKFNSPIRLGKSCFSWINSHPQLKKSGICVART